MSTYSVVLALLFLLSACSGHSPLQESIENSFDDVLGEVSRIVASDEEVTYEQCSDEIDSCLRVLSSRDSSQEMRSRAETSLARITSLLDLEKGGRRLCDRLVEGYLGESNYYTTYEHMITFVLGTFLNKQKTDQLYKYALFSSYMIFEPLSDEVLLLLGDRAQSFFNETVSQILSEADGSDRYFLTVYSTVCLCENPQETYGLTEEEMLGKYKEAFSGMTDKQHAAALMKKTEGIGGCWDKIQLFTAIMKECGADCLGLDTIGVSTMPDTGSSPDDLVRDAIAVCYTIEYQNGEVHDNSFVIPEINIDSDNARELNDEIIDYFISFNDFYEQLSQCIANYDWDGYNIYVSFSYDCEIVDGVIVITVTESGGDVGKEAYTKDYVYKYSIEDDAKLG